jgi:hypothetical protein
VTAAGNGEQDIWVALAARLLHPLQVEIIEAMSWIDQPLSAADLAEVVNPTLPWPHFVHHLRRLTRLKAIKPAERFTRRNMTTIRFRLHDGATIDER